MRFRDAARQQQTDAKASGLFSADALADGSYRKHPYAWVLPQACAAENLFEGLREDTLAYFCECDIKWHDGQDGNPSHHLLDSQVCCVNHLGDFAHRPGALAHLLRRVFPGIKRMLPIECGRYVAYEWIGAENYLHELKPGKRVRTRGANYTSADAAVMFERQDGKKQIVLIEWKYTERYYETDLAIARSGTSRLGIYRHLYERDDFVLDKDALPSYASLFYEPFYQLFRQQALAHEMELAHELGADVVSLLDIAPRANEGFQRVTSPDLRPLADSVSAVWVRLLRQPDRFASLPTEGLFGAFPVQQAPESAPWREYTRQRYGW